ncbi:hypothetical protein D0T53_06795 [Dysgonomonas sp. 216]|uniref:lipocalin-like domain-containing protein n=1 Tax=Dysgonomonas sp. 216 TaxID=2302934 RepID=UPI0013D2DB33|nr:lipocalin-like domain-containing protein [Dysgonomonas sp. 216]NDW18622.1 hypothetical protein [Dysgonomonas sp. 216]
MEILDLLKYILVGAVIGGLVLLFSSCGDDYAEKGIEGQWQLTKIVRADGSEEVTDSVYYSFKKGVFRYLVLKSDIESDASIGYYNEAGDVLTVSVLPGVCIVNPCDFEDGQIEKENGHVDWIFRVKKQNSSKLELEFNDELLLFRKY